MFLIHDSVSGPSRTMPNGTHAATESSPLIHGYPPVAINGSAFAHSPFDSVVPKGLTLHDRLVTCRQKISDPPAQIEATLAGRGTRSQFNGLGFDYTRLLAPTDPLGGNWSDPVIEFLAFFGLIFLPVRGDSTSLRVRGWKGRSLKRGSFTWPTWSEPLDSSNIDALLDQFWNGARSAAAAVFATVPYQPRGSADSTRAFASERIV